MIMPKMGESIMEGTILSWLKKEGDLIEQDESVLEVATDKVDTEVPSIHWGILKEILVKEGDVVQIGAPIAVIDTQKGESEAAESPDKTTKVVEENEELSLVDEPLEVTSPGSNGNGRLAQPVS